MTIETSKTHDPGIRRPVLFLGIFLRPWQMIFDAITARRTIAALSKLDDNQLKDIGISRSEIGWRGRSTSSPRKYVDPE
jgi:uncharacterized protein YjiS (DUF1127 family)